MMVWIHGGSLLVGSGEDSDAGVLAKLPYLGYAEKCRWYRATTISPNVLLHLTSVLIYLQREKNEEAQTWIDNGLSTSWNANG